MKIYSHILRECVSLYVIENLNSTESASGSTQNHKSQLDWKFPSISEFRNGKNYSFTKKRIYVDQRSFIEYRVMLLRYLRWGKGQTYETDSLQTLWNFVNGYKSFKIYNCSYSSVHQHIIKRVISKLKVFKKAPLLAFQTHRQTNTSKFFPPLREKSCPSGGKWIQIWPGRSPGTFTYWDWYRFWRCRNKGAALIGKQHDCK